MLIDALSVLCAQLTRDLLAIAKFLFGYRYLYIYIYITTTVAPIGVKICMMCPGCVFFPFPKSEICPLRMACIVFC